MTPEERRDLADRLEWEVDRFPQQTTVTLDKIVVISAAAALRESTNAHIIQLCAERDDAEAERDAARAEVARLREGIERHRGACYDANSNDERLHALLDTEGDTDE